VEVELIDRKENRIKAFISEVDAFSLRGLSPQWKFQWGKKTKSNSTKIYKLDSGEIEGLLKITFPENDFFIMELIEVSPRNFSSRGKFVNVAEILVSYACLLSFRMNIGPYKGYLTFKSKGKLIDYYIEKYNAELIYREQMMINPVVGMSLIKKHLNLEL